MGSHWWFIGLKECIGTSQSKLDPLLFYYISKHCKHQFIFSSFKSSLIQYVYLIYDGLPPLHNSLFSEVVHFSSRSTFNLLTRRCLLLVIDYSVHLNKRPHGQVWCALRHNNKLISEHCLNSSLFVSYFAPPF